MFKFKSFFKILFSTFLICGFSLHADWTEAFKEKVRRGEKPEWMMKQIHKDLAPFNRKKISKSDLDAVQKLSRRVQRFQIRNGKVQVLSVMSYNILVDSVKRLAALAPIPNLDFVISSNDSFYHDPNLSSCKGPLFSFAKRECDEGIILMPDLGALVGYSENLVQVKEGNAKFPWETKLEKAFWRGVNSGFLPGSLAFMNPKTYHHYPRCKLVELSLRHPEKIDARFNQILHVAAPMSKIFWERGFVSNTVSISEHLKYKYQILIDGYTCAFHRAWWQMFANSLTFKQDSPDYQWYYGELKPYVHYVPVSNDLSDLLEKMDWAKKHDAECIKIVNRANQFAETHIKDEDMYLYLYLLLCEYAKICS